MNFCSSSLSGFRRVPFANTCPSGSRDQRWATFLRNHAKATVACDFFVTVTATFRLFYVLVLIEHGSRRLLHFNVTEHPSADWTAPATAGSSRMRRFSISDP